MDNESEVYFTLPEHVQRKIDKAFYDATCPTNGKRKSERQRGAHSLTKKRKVTPVDSGGGFILDDQDDGSPYTGGDGGFIIDDASVPGSSSGGGNIVDEDYDDKNQEDDRQVEKPKYISLSTISGALELLGLPSDDAQVMGVFRRAAADWDEVDDTGGVNPHGEEGLVSLKDWRAVCGVLLEGADVAEESEERGEALDFEDLEDTNPSDEYAGDSGDDSDEYIEVEELSRRRVRRTRGTVNSRTRRGDSDLSSLSDDNSPTTKPLTLKQRETCLHTFALFLDSSRSPNLEDLPKQKLRINDLQRVAGLLKEKLKAEEMVEMLESFSTSPDKSMSLEDFERMMVRAKLV
ncbi:hypothetical protein E1B28_008452 [Marasmius oreades]|uniref:Uncharacterized protein n=1 Tax=Marasmius oreades TaxID=181124 RepID=A0A9P7UTB1_9AGAR|nr:uncharacterized protein E1B28_008452 [Marasmius oreades]KAG7092071.1 hypothetical protein E1B28_008452 [Marasmius oreades]